MIELEPDAEASAAADGIRDCFVGCLGECYDGQDFSCADAYDWPGNLGDSTIRVHQTLSLLDLTASTSPLADAEVEFCPGSADCERSPLARTDADGVYEIDLAIPLSPVSVAGFRGYRIVRRSDLTTQFLRTNVPILVDRSEATLLLSRLSSDFLTQQIAFALGADAGERGIVLFQVFDCQGVGAGGARVVLPAAEGAAIAYKGEVGMFSQDATSTLASQEGAGLIAGLERGVSHRLEIYAPTGELVGEDEIDVPAEGIMYVTLYPKARRL